MSSPSNACPVRGHGPRTQTPSPWSRVFAHGDRHTGGGGTRPMAAPASAMVSRTAVGTATARVCVRAHARAKTEGWASKPKQACRRTRAGLHQHYQPANGCTRTPACAVRNIACGRRACHSGATSLGTTPCPQLMPSKWRLIRKLSSKRLLQTPMLISTVFTVLAASLCARVRRTSRIRDRERANRSIRNMRQ